jgi:hypothetical protein
LQNRIILLDSNLIIDDNVLIGGYKFQYFQALDNLAVDNGLDFLPLEEKEALFEGLDGLFYGRDHFTGRIIVPPQIRQAFGVNHFDQNSIEDAAKWIRCGVSLSEGAVQFLEDIRCFFSQRLEYSEEEDESYNVGISILTQNRAPLLYHAIAAKVGDTGVSVINEIEAGFFPDDRSNPQTQNFRQTSQVYFPNSEFDDFYYVTTESYRLERIHELGIAKGLLVSSSPYRNTETAYEGYANVAAEIRAFLFEQEEGGLLPNAPDDGRPVYAAPELLN